MSLRAITFYLVFAAAVPLADGAVVGTSGINSGSLTLTGANIGIGQVEPGRPGIMSDGFSNYNTYVVPAGVYRLNGSAVTSDASQHATRVGGVMISKAGGSLVGVAPDAKLYASAYVGTDFNGENVLISTQYVASRNGGDVRAINHSYGVALGFGFLDGSTYLTRGLDWSASAHDTLHVIAGNQSVGENPYYPIPTDNYNGVTIAASTNDGSGTFDKVASFNTYDEDAEGDRTSVDLIAPGESIELTNPGIPSTATADGTSFATPHVTGTVALLQEFADDKLINEPSSYWSGSPGTANANRHEVMKAVLLNSADKISGVHGSSRTVVSRDDSGNYDWYDSPAANDPTIPLDIEFGAGHLNAARAVQQFENGEWDPFSPIPRIGWDLGETGGPGTTLRYPFAASLDGGGHIAITLAWDKFTDKTGSSTSFSLGDNFFGDGLNDLDVYLMPAGWADLSEAVEGLYSISSDNNVEHIFAELPSTGNYEIVVSHFPGGLETDQEFALAWWYGSSSTILAGDFNADGAVNGRDFLAWQRGNSPNPFSSSDLGDWQSAYNNGALSAATAVPEPSSSPMLLGVVLLSGALLRIRESVGSC